MNNISRDATDIKEAIRSAESLSDELLVTLAALRTKILRARSNPSIAPHEGQAALMRLQKAEQSILAGSSNLFRAHDDLSAIAIRMDVEHPTPPSGITDDEVKMEIVA